MMAMPAMAATGDVVMKDVEFEGAASAADKQTMAVAKVPNEVNPFVPAKNKSESGSASIAVTAPLLSYVPDVTFAQVPSRGYENVDLKMDIIKPMGKTTQPAVIFVTGGGFINANKANYLQQRVKLAEAGYVVASIEYRVAPTAIMPQPLEDVKAAVRYLRANAEKFNIDPTNIGLWGSSAGGYLVAMAGATNGNKIYDKGAYLDQSSDVQAVVDFYGLSDLTQIAMDYSSEIKELHKSSGATEALWVNGSGVFGGIDGGVLATPERTAAANPIRHISAKTAPFLLMHGDQDTSVSPGQTRILHEALIEKGIASERYVIKGAKHGGEYWVQEPVVNKVIAFFNQYLKK